MVVGKAGEDAEPFLPEVKADEPPPLAQRMYDVFVQVTYRVAAVDSHDAIEMVSSDLGKGRTYRYSIEESASFSTRPVTQG